MHDLDDAVSDHLGLGAEALEPLAAPAEFAASGLACARVDRIAAGVGCNKQLIYAHFGSKQGLFDEVAATHVRQLLDSVPMTADDLPGYAVRLFEHTVTHPELVRLTMWQRLEGGDLAELADLEATSMAAKAKAVKVRRGPGWSPRPFPPLTSSRS